MTTKPSGIAASFVKAQKAFGPALKTSVNPHFKSRYADLAACVEAVIEALNDNGIGLIQHTHDCDNGVIVETILLHESGEQLTGGRLHVPATKMDAQGYGSALSYARRYSLMAITGLAPVDDDGNAAAATKPVKQVKPLSAEQMANIGALAEEVNYKGDMAALKKRSADQYGQIIAFLEKKRGEA